MKTLKNLLHFAIIGIGVGSIMTTICLCIFSGKTCNTKDLVVWLVASALMGMLTMLMYCQKLRLAIATLIHSVITFCIVLISSLICGYGANIVEIVKNISPVFFVIYIAIYLVFYLIAKINEKKVNDILKNN